MSLPASLAYGVISIYNIYQTGNTGMIAPANHNFGEIDQISQYGILYAQVGQSVLFNGNNIICRLNYSSKNYTLLEEGKIILTESVAP